MKDPRTRISEGETDFERDLLRSWQREQPSDEARQNALALVGTVAALGVSAAASTATAASAGVVGSAAGVGSAGPGVAGGVVGVGSATVSVAPKAAVVGAVAIGKWLAAGAVVAGLTASIAVDRARSPSSVATPQTLREPPALRARSAVTRPSFSAPATLDVVPASSGSSNIGALPMRTQPPKTSSRPASVPKAPIAGSAPPESPITNASAPSQNASPAALALGEQVATIDRARAALAAGDAVQTLRMVDEYDRLFPNGILAQEATALRIEALLKQGNRDVAADLAHRFLTLHPTSPYAAWIRVALEPPSNL
jgi:hypothetical protein